MEEGDAEARMTSSAAAAAGLDLDDDAAKHSSLDADKLPFVDDEEDVVVAALTAKTTTRDEISEPTYGPPPSKKIKGNAESNVSGVNPSESTTGAKKKVQKKKAVASEKPAFRSKKRDGISIEQDDISQAAVEDVRMGDTEDGEDGEEEENQEDLKLYCICQARYDEERMMIACDRCDDWYHAVCMNVKEEEAELVDMFLCPKCASETGQQTTWKPKCLRDACTHAALRPLSRYCGERCGMMAAAIRINKLKSASTNGQSGGGGTATPALAASAARKGQQEKAVMEKLLQIPNVQSAQRREGIIVWETSTLEKRMQWLQLLGRSDVVEHAVTSTMQTTGNDHVEQADWLHPDDATDTLPHLEELAQLDTQQRETRREIALVNTKLDILTARLLLLHLVEDRLATLEPLRGEEAEATSAFKSKKIKSKKTKAAANVVAEDANVSPSAPTPPPPPPSRGQPRCGYDERLHWDDARFSAWSSSSQGKAMLNEELALDGRLDEPAGAVTNEDEGGKLVDRVEEAEPTHAVAPTICGQSKRKCKRHAEWSAVRQVDFEFEKDRLTQRLSYLSNKAQRIETDMSAVRQATKQTVMQERERRRQADERLAQTLANEGTRRAAQML